MAQRSFMSRIVVCTFIVLFSFVAIGWSQTKENQIVSLSDSIGTEIDSTEKETYHLFPDIKGFQSGQLFAVSRSKFRLAYSYLEDSRLQNKSTKISTDAFQLTQLHVKLTDEYHRYASLEPQALQKENVFLYRLALKYASQTRYDLTTQLLADLIQNYSESPEALQAKEFRPGIERILKSKKALIWKGSLLDQTGRTDLLIFSGYYGIWLGIATPIFLEASSAEAYGAGLLLGGPLALTYTHYVTKNASISKGKAAIISLGGHLGTWQGIGWAGVSDAEGENIVGMGELGGLAGIAIATLLANKIDFSEGHATLTSSGLQWGAWYGLVWAGISGDEGKDLLSDMLIGSDLFVLGTGFAAKDVKMSRARVRLINLGGALGIVFGFGINLLVKPEETSTVMAIAGLGSVGGLALGTTLTKDYDKGKELTFAPQLSPSVELSLLKDKRVKATFPNLDFQKDSFNNKDLMPEISLKLKF